ncbi:MAG: chorismate synthase [Massiliimalia sp.]|jgi:chorismate synthase
MPSIWNNGIQISIFGESHSTAIGVVIDNLPAGEPIDMDAVREFLRRRQAKSDGTTTSRIEPDRPEILSGLIDGHTTGTPLCMMIKNTNVRSGDYRNVQTTARPGHADYTGYEKYHGANDIRGGGHFSGRLTACMVMAGAVCGQILERRGIYAGAHLLSVGEIQDQKCDPIYTSKQDILNMRQLPFPVIQEEKRESIIQCINKARMNLDSVGGVVECIAIGMPAGIGGPIFQNLESMMASFLFSIPGVKGVEFGEGFHASTLLGSQNNDPFYMDGDQVKTRTNRHGGILGGISSGMPIPFRVAFKPTPSIAQSQNTVDFVAKQDTVLSIVGRHDPCIAVRAVPVVEAACNIVLLSAMVNEKGLCGW